MKNKRLITVILCFLITLFIFIFRDTITSNIIFIFNNYRQASWSETFSDYSKNKNFKYVSITNNFVPNNYQDLMNILYTSLDRRYESITIYCPNEYVECIEDVQKIAGEDNETALTIVGNLISPYNNFSSIPVSFDTTGKITYTINYLYDSEMVEFTNQYIDNIINTIITDDMSDRDKIIAVHDYIVKETEYDINYENELKIYGKAKHPSDTAYGLFKDKLAICSAYADALALIFDRLGFENFKVASQTHIWNVVRIDGEYLHVDATWDDPVNNIFNETVHDYLLIDTNRLLELDSDKHNFDKSVYLELK